MEIVFSDKIFVSIVQHIRDTCKKHVKFDDFASVSGFLSFDIDGNTQYRFVLNEVIDKENNGEGNSVGLSTHHKCKNESYRKLRSSLFQAVNWNLMKRLVHSKKDSKCNLKKSSCSFSPNTVQNEIPEALGANSARTVSLLLSKQTNMQKSLSGPIGQQHFSKSRNKMSNRTFTREEEKLKAEVIPKRTISNSTINLSNSKSFDEKCASEISHVRKTANMLNTMTGLNNHHLYKTTHKNIVFQSAIEKSPAKKFWNKKKVIKENVNNFCAHQSLSPENQFLIDHNNFKLDNIKNTDQEDDTLQFIQLPVVKKEDSDISIGSTRPKYLVQHNGELLLPCPKLRDIIGSDPVESSINFTKVISSCESTNTLNADQFSLNTSLISKGVVEINKNIIFSKSHGDISNKKDNISATSSETNNTASSVEMDFINDIPVMTAVTGKVKDTSGSQKKNKSQHVIDSVSFHKKKSRMFKWMKLFKKDDHPENGRRDG